MLATNGLATTMTSVVAGLNAGQLVAGTSGITSIDVSSALDAFVTSSISRPDQTRPDQTRPDQTRPDQTRPDH